MSKYLLDFGTLLRALAELYGTNEFDSRTVAEQLSGYLYLKTKNPRILTKISLEANIQ